MLLSVDSAMTSQPRAPVFVPTPEFVVVTAGCTRVAAGCEAPTWSDCKQVLKQIKKLVGGGKDRASAAAT